MVRYSDCKSEDEGSIPFRVSREPLVLIYTRCGNASRLYGGAKAAMEPPKLQTRVRFLPAVLDGPVVQSG